MLGIQLAYPFSRLLGLALEIDAYAPLVRDVFTYTESDGRVYPLFRPNSVGVTTHFGVQLRI
jgi:hypothetical protein